MAVPKRFRRWLLAIGGIVLLSLAGQAAWRRRPLSATERPLVGVWALSDTADHPRNLDYQIEFRSDRVLLDGVGESAFRTGTWSAAEGMLTRDYEVPRPAVTWSPLYRTIPSYLSNVFQRGGRLRRTASVTFVSPDQFRTDVITEHASLYEPTVWWHRVQAPKANPAP